MKQQKQVKKHIWPRAKTQKIPNYYILIIYMLWNFKNFEIIYNIVLPSIFWLYYFFQNFWLEFYL